MIRTLSSLALLAVLGACASTYPGAGGAPAPVLKQAEPTLPVSAFIDSAALHQALLAAPAAPAEFRLKPLYVVVYDKNGALEEVRVMSERQFPAEYGRRMVELLRANVRPRTISSKPAVNYVWMESGSSPKIAVVADLVEARPRLQNTATVSRELSRASERLQRANPGLAGRSLTAQVAVRVSEEGLPEEPRLAQSTGSIEIDREIIGVARLMRFAPASLNGYPVKVLVQLPVTLNFQQPQPQPQPQPGMPVPARP